MLKLDHLTIIAPTLAEGAAHARNCLDLDVPFGTRHDYMGTHNHRLRIGESVYLEIVALDPQGTAPPRPRWFGLDDQKKVRQDWEQGRRLRGWVASTTNLNTVLALHGTIFGDRVALPFDNPDFAFTIPSDGSLPLDGAAPSIIDHQGDSRYIATIPDFGARLASLTLEHPAPDRIAELYLALAIDNPPALVRAREPRYKAVIQTPSGPRELT